MRAWIRYKGQSFTSNNKEHSDRVTIASDKHNYTRFGKYIPHQEIEIDVLKYFGCNADRAAYIANQLKADSRIDCKLSEEAKSAIKRMIENNKNKKKNETTEKKETPLIDAQKIKDELRQELREEMKKELQSKKKEPVKEETKKTVKQETKDK
jgi:hypothetical protein